MFLGTETYLTLGFFGVIQNIRVLCYFWNFKSFPYSVILLPSKKTRLIYWIWKDLIAFPSFYSTKKQEFQKERPKRPTGLIPVLLQKRSMP